MGTINIDIDRIDRLAAMPATVAHLAILVNDPDAGAAEFARVLELDVALTANILKLANSAWAGLGRDVTLVREAVLRLGMGTILKLAVGSAVAGPMKRPCPGYSLEEDELWRHSVAAALAAETMVRRKAPTIPPTAFTAALLHDVGKLLMSRFLDPEVRREIAGRELRDGLTYVNAERLVLGVDHAEVGGEIARRWGLPAAIIDSIAFHHRPQRKQEPITDTVHLANAVAKLTGVGLGSEALNLSVDADCARRLGFGAAELEGLCMVVMEGLDLEEHRYVGETDESPSRR